MPVKSYNLHLKGYVGDKDFDSSTVDRVLKARQNKSVDVLIDSTGGALATGLSICAGFRNHGNVNVHFVGLNASAATIASIGAKHISMDRGAMYLVHRCLTPFMRVSNLNADDFAEMIARCQKTKDDLEKLDECIASIYAARCKRKPEDLLELMKVGGWLSADEALQWGFVDEITEFAEDRSPAVDSTLAAAMAAADMPIPVLPVADGTRSTGLPACESATVMRDSSDDDGTGVFRKLIDSISSIFSPGKSEGKDVSQKNQVDMKKVSFKNLGAVSGDTEFSMADDNMAAVSGDALEKFDARIGELSAQAEKDKAEIADLKAKLAAALDSKPADTSAKVTEPAKDGGEKKPGMKSAVEKLRDTFNNARGIFDSLC